jgi:hypothetical protein
MGNGVVVAADRGHFERDGKPFFYLGDTVWAVFANATLEEWEQYLALRAQQGFNVVQISILPIYHDTSLSDRNIDPFHRDGGGRLDFGRANEAYFEKAQAMLRMAVDRGFVPSLGLLWCNYAPDSWAARKLENATVMPLDAVAPYVRYAAACFEPFSPIYFVSGDTKFESPREIAYYEAALEALKNASPRSLASMHTSPDGELPEALVRSPHLDFTMYQSGHRAATQDLAWKLAERLAALPVRRPIVNAEPCYEAHGRTPGGQGRFTAREVRRAMWQGLLSGARAGVTYGGHGLWSWHRRGMSFLNAANSLEPLEWHSALRLPGAWDYAFARWAFETFDLFCLEPSQALLREAGAGVRAAAGGNGERVAVYTPQAGDIEVAADLRSHRLTLALLGERRIVVPRCETTSSGSLVRMADSNEDALLVAVPQA